MPLRAEGRDRDAVQYLEQAIAISPDHARARVVVRDIQKALRIRSKLNTQERPDTASRRR